jgi:hypothetical protein
MRTRTLSPMVLWPLVSIAIGACGDEPTRDELDATEDVTTDISSEDSNANGGDSESDVADADLSAVEDGSADIGPLEDIISDVDTLPESSGFPAEGILVRILEPGAHGTAETLSPNVILSGVLFGDATSLTWQLGSQTGTSTPSPFWQAGPVTLSPGDNAFVITATDGARTVSDRLVLTYNPAFRFDEPLTARPSQGWVGSVTDVVFTLSTTRYSNVDTSTLKLLSVDENGSLISELGGLKDDGRVSNSGDEIEQDGVFTWTGPISCTSAEPRYFRASVKVGTNQSYLAVSSVVRMDCLERLPVVACEARKSIIDTAAASLVAGAEASEVLRTLEANPLVLEAGLTEDGTGVIWIVFEDLVLGAVISPRADMRGGGPPSGFATLARAAELQSALAVSDVAPLQVGSKRAMILSPRLSEFAASDEGPELATQMVGLNCPRFEVESGRALGDAEASLALMRRASDYGVLSIATHGALAFDALSPELLTRLGWAHTGAQELLWTGSPVECANLLSEEESCLVNGSNPSGGCPAGTRCLVTRGVASDDGASGEGYCVDDTQVDLRRARLVMTNLGYAITPSFFSGWRGAGFPSSLIHLGACSSLRNGSLASALYAAGARAISGFSGPVSSPFARTAALSIFEILTGGIISDHFEATEDPGHAGTMHRLFGARNLSLEKSDLINGDFENNNLVGWRRQGDGRAVSKFGPAQPVSGKSMGLISTGLGFSVETGSLEQTLCIPADKRRMILYWKFMSEEFKEWCGTEKFQDRFSAKILAPNGTELGLAEVRVDDLCGYEDGTCDDCPAPRACDASCASTRGCYLDENGICAEDFNCQCGRHFVGLTAASIGFDYGGVYEVEWQRSEVDISSLAGLGPVNLVLSVEDSGDSSFDTAVLVDAIAFE